MRTFAPLGQQLPGVSTTICPLMVVPSRVMAGSLDGEDIPQLYSIAARPPAGKKPKRDSLLKYNVAVPELAEGPSCHRIH